MNKEFMKISKQIGEKELEIIRNGSFGDIFEMLLSGNNEISKADEMLKELGYVIEERDNVIILNRKNCKQGFRRSNVIYFDKNRKELKIGDRTSRGCDARKLSMEELQAINEKVKELGWI